MVWVAVAVAIWHAVRSPSLRAALDDGMSWLVAVAVIAVAVARPRAGTPMLGVVSILPCLATASAIWIERLLQAGGVRRILGVTWILVATLWTLAIVPLHKRIDLDRDDVGSVRAYLASNDGNDFVISNLSDDAVVRAAVDRRSWSVIGEHESITAERARTLLLEVFEAVGSDHVHAVIFTSAASSHVDSLLGESKKYRDLGVLLDATGARRVLHFDNFDVYRIDRNVVLDRIGASIPLGHEIDFSSRAANRNKLLGWRGPRLGELHPIGVTTISGYYSCSNPQGCQTAPSESGFSVPDARVVDRAQLMIRVEHACELRLTVRIEPAFSPLWFLADLQCPTLGLSIADFTTSQCARSQVVFDVPKRYVREGINVVTFATELLSPLNPRAELRSLAIDLGCDPAPGGHARL
ncbi:MAG TPA: hypothetical protein VMJ10_00170 [Kofleriaceae bacterium]|nr:hypothetical protein [Kofleriaceae bacterium]